MPDEKEAVVPVPQGAEQEPKTLKTIVVCRHLDYVFLETLI
jgi:hypothetical protein